ncbi:MAG: hypothetical protein IM466_06140 [Microcystis sp. M04BS1]|nr:hypothetical protein [Microcystis sp. M04BS1]
MRFSLLSQPYLSNQTREEIKAKINRATVAGMFNGTSERLLMALNSIKHHK